MRARITSLLACMVVLGVSLIGCKPSASDPDAVLVGTPTATPISVTVIYADETATPIPDLPTPETPEPTATLAPDAVGPGSGALNMRREGGQLGLLWNLKSMRYGVHDDRLRIVWEMAEAGTSVPRYTIVEVDNAADPFPTGYDATWGTTRIDIRISDLYAREYPLAEQLPIQLDDAPVGTRIDVYPTYDDALLGFSIGLERPAEYVVHELVDPVRIVVDILY